MAEFGNIDRMLHEDGNANDGNDEDGRNTTGPFTFSANYNSTPGSSGEHYELTTMNREGEKAQENR